MSGGFFDYVQDIDASDLVHASKWLDQVKSMAARLREEGSGGEEAARETEAAAKAIAAIQAAVWELDFQIRSLRPVWKAIDYFESHDWGPDDVAKALATYNASRGSGAGNA